MSNASRTSAELSALGFRREGEDGMEYMVADIGGGVRALLDCTGTGTWRCWISAPSAMHAGRMACGRGSSPRGAVMAGIRAAGTKCIAGIRAHETAAKDLRGKLDAIVEAKRKLDTANTKGK